MRGSNIYECAHCGDAIREKGQVLPEVMQMGMRCDQCGRDEWRSVIEPAKEPSPEFKKHRAVYNREYRRLLRADPERDGAYRLRQAIRDKERLDALRPDPEWRAAERIKHRARQATYRKRHAAKVKASKRAAYLAKRKAF